MSPVSAGDRRETLRLSASYRVRTGRGGLGVVRGGLSCAPVWNDASRRSCHHSCGDPAVSFRRARDWQTTLPSLAVILPPSRSRLGTLPRGPKPEPPATCRRRRSL